ncbi:MAG: 5-oxoprolinase subunit PxpB [Planctomycetales bacterium]|nr:5-oxoprolinase subunit PxpB [Planctomycetales bacterium]
MEIVPFGDSALLLRFGEEISPVLSASARRVAVVLEAEPPAGFVEAVPSYASVAVHFDPALARAEDLALEIARRLGRATGEAGPPGRLVEVPVRYGGADGPDLPDVARLRGLSEAEVVAAHSGVEYLVYAMGFMPGFPYLGVVPEAIRVPRLDSPRPAVPAGSVGIAGAQAGIYPAATPGGWRLIGRTDLRLFDPARRPPATLAPGDRVRFVPCA